MANDYIVMYDENGQPYIEHASLRGMIDSAKRAGARYLAKVRTAAGNVRYIYDPNELRAYQQGGRRATQSSDIAGAGSSVKVDTAGNKHHKAGGSENIMRIAQATGAVPSRDPMSGGRDVTRRKRIRAAISTISRYGSELLSNIRDRLAKRRGLRRAGKKMRSDMARGRENKNAPISGSPLDWHNHEQIRGKNNNTRGDR